MTELQILLSCLAGGIALVLIIAIALSRSSYFRGQQHRDAGFHVSRKADVPVQFFGEGFNEDVP